MFQDEFRFDEKYLRFQDEFGFDEKYGHIPRI